MFVLPGEVLQVDDLICHQVAVSARRLESSARSDGQLLLTEKRSRSDDLLVEAVVSYWLVTGLGSFLLGLHHLQRLRFHL